MVTLVSSKQDDGRRPKIKDWAVIWSEEQLFCVDTAATASAHSPPPTDRSTRGRSSGLGLHGILP